MFPSPAEPQLATQFHTHNYPQSLAQQYMYEPQGKWLTWEFKNEWRTDGREIGWAEMVAIELATWTLITANFKNCHITDRSDNQGIVGALKAGRLRGTQQNLILCEIVKLLQDNDLWNSTAWVSTSENSADGPSQGVFPRKSHYFHIRLIYLFI